MTAPVDTERKPTFALIGAAGFVAPRHIDAIHACGGKLVAACDPNDSVGVLDRYGEKVAFCLGPHETWVDPPRTDFVVVATPNDLHGQCAVEALRRSAHVILEKPAALTASEIDRILKWEYESEGNVWPILQMRLNPAVLAWRTKSGPSSGTKIRHTVSLDYVTPRGPWYWESWKGDEARSGGIATNLGVHLFDVLLWLFGDVQNSEVTYRDRPSNPKAMAGRLTLARADVTWSLSTLGAKPSRLLRIDDEVIDLSEGFTSLHTAVYREILAGRWYGLADARPAIALCETLRTLAPAASPR